MPVFIDPNTSLNFEQRVLYPDKYPVIQNDDGNIATHKMAWTTVGNKFIAFPTIIQTPDGGLYQFQDPGKAVLYALKNKEFREFNKAEDAEAYANNGYKAFWGKGK